MRPTIEMKGIDMKNLYRVRLRGMKISTTGNAYGDSYVIASNSDEAYQKVRKFIDSAALGFKKERELESVELLAGEAQYNDTGHMIFL